MLYQKELERDFKVCRHCSHHLRLGAWERIGYVADPGSFQERDGGLSSVDILGFPEYEGKLASDRAKTGLAEAVVWGEAALNGTDIVLLVADANFRMASMGSVVGEKVTRALEHAAAARRPAVFFCASGGARMQEGIVSLMQMAKTTAAVRRLQESGTPYLSVLTDPTTAGVLASFASLGDVVLAEPSALVGFAGPRVIEQSLKVKLPPGTHTAEFALARGMVDMIVPRRELVPTLSRLLGYLGGKG
jgi:acetyl-CoA carboxylase carboxyl transferase subunit beta